MNRDIKFRAWSKETKKMYLPVKGCDLLIRIDGKLFVDIDIKENVGISEAYNLDLILMQYTGLKDRNGVEVYEGDILKSPYGRHPIYVVEYYENGFYLNDVAKSQFNENYKVIGNIHENKELL